MATISRDTPCSVAELARRLDQNGIGGRGRRSPLTCWMWAHYDELATMLDELEPSWKAVADHLGALGFSNSTNKPPDPARVRKTWWSVQKMKASAAAKRAARVQTPILGPGEIAIGVRAVSPVQATDNSRKPAVRRNPDPQGEAAGSPPLADGAEASAASDRIQRLREQMSARTVPMP